MAESGPDLQRRGILIALRAAAIVIIATGVNDVIAGARPDYEPLYAYLAAIALVVWLDGVVLGVLTALVAVAFYALLFIPPGTASLALLFPLGASFAAIVASGVVRGLVRARRRRAEPVLFPRVSQPLLVSAPAAVDHTKVLSAIDELRDDLHAAVTELTAAREREAAMQQAYADAREAHAARLHHAEEESARRAAEAETERAERTYLETAARAQADESARLLAEAREEATTLRARIAELEQGQARSIAEFDERLATIVTHLAEDHEADLGKAMEEKEEARAETRSLQVRLTNLQRLVEEERQLVTARMREADEHFRNTHQDATRVLAETRAAAQREIDKLSVRVAELERGRVEVPRVAATSARPRILIAHPDADLRMSARASLERAGYEIFVAADGLEALRTAISERPAIVIADAVMPKMDGRELCQLLKSQEKTAHIRVVLLTRPNDAPPRGDLPPDEILRKPVPLETLKATLAALLAG